MQGKLPLTFPKVANEQKMTTEQYPGAPVGSFSHQSNYSEGQINGYRWYDKHPSVKPAFPFGHGLSYGNMTFSDLKVTDRTVSFTMAGTGCDPPQLYLSYPTAETDPTVPAKVLRYFKKVCAGTTGAQETTAMSFTLTDRDVRKRPACNFPLLLFSLTGGLLRWGLQVSNWNVDESKWAVTSGKFGVSVGSSSQDIKLTGSLTVA